jgi:glycosyltransferase involved in cell wall biosynthesis
MSYKITVIIPAFNTENYIEKCLTSISNQTLKDIEIIVIDDGSSDNTLAILKAYQEHEPRMKILSFDENKKQGYAKNLGIACASGEYLAFIDSDDYVDLTYLENLYNTAKKYNADIATCNLLKHKKHINKYNIKYSKEIFVTNIDKKIKLCQDKKKFFFYTSNKIYKRELIENNDIKFTENCFYEDVEFATKTIFYAQSIVSVPNTTYHYVYRKDSTINKKDNDGKKKQNLILAYALMQKFCKEKSIKLPERLNYYTSSWFSPFIKTYFGLYKQKELLLGLFPISSRVLNNDFPVDLVYCWVDGADKKWQKELNYWKSKTNQEINFQAIDDGRFVENDELKFSLRSVEKYANWINKIYIVTDNQVPHWLNLSNPKIKVIDHKDIIPKENLPLFNSEAIESCIANIPNLSEHFIYANDDMCIGRYITKNFFFNNFGKPIVRLKQQVSKNYLTTSLYSRSILHQQKIIEKDFRKNYHYAPHHNIDAYSKKSFLECVNYYEKEFELLRSHKFRTENDINRFAINYYILANNQGVLKKYSRIDSYLSPFLRLKNKIKSRFQVDSRAISMKNKNPYGIFKKYKPSLFCINDGEGISNFDRRRIKIFLEEVFLQKSSFEIDDDLLKK